MYVYIVHYFIKFNIIVGWCFYVQIVSLRVPVVRFFFIHLQKSRHHYMIELDF